jgi:hypothetical protein
VCDSCVGVSRELPDVWLSGPDVIAGIRVTPVNSAASELSKVERGGVSAIDKVTSHNLGDLEHL